MVLSHRIEVFFEWIRRLRTRFVAGIGLPVCCCTVSAKDGACNTRWVIDRERCTQSYRPSVFHTRRRPSSPRFKESCSLRLHPRLLAPLRLSPLHLGPGLDVDGHKLCCDDDEDKSTPGDVTSDLPCSETAYLPSGGDSFAASSTLGPNS